MEREFIPINIAVLTVSDTRTMENDTSGGYIVQRMTEAGHQVVAHVITKDSEVGIRAQLAQWIADPRVDVVIATGGTGVTPRDVTPEALAPLITKHIPGFGELFRAMGRHNRRSAHIHVKIWRAGRCLLTTQLFIPGNPYLESDYVEGAVSDDLIIDMKPVAGADNLFEARFDFAVAVR